MGKILFAQNTEGIILWTNNSIEQFFRKIRRNVRKRSGNMATGRYLSMNGSKIAIFQNIAMLEYVKTVFGLDDIASEFAKHRKEKKKGEMTRRKVIELVDMGKEKLISGTLRKDSFSEDMIDEAYMERNSWGL